MNRNDFLKSRSFLTKFEHECKHDHDFFGKERVFLARVPPLSLSLFPPIDMNSAAGEIFLGLFSRKCWEAFKIGI